MHVILVGEERLAIKKYVQKIINAVKIVLNHIIKGECYLDSNNQAKCRCFIGWQGDTCETADCDDILCAPNGNKKV